LTDEVKLNPDLPYKVYATKGSHSTLWGEFLTHGLALKEVEENAGAASFLIHYHRDAVSFQVTEYYRLTYYLDGLNRIPEQSDESAGEDVADRLQASLGYPDWLHNIQGERIPEPVSQLAPSKIYFKTVRRYTKPAHGPKRKLRYGLVLVANGWEIPLEKTYPSLTRAINVGNQLKKVILNGQAKAS